MTDRGAAGAGIIFVCASLFVDRGSLFGPMLLIAGVALLVLNLEWGDRGRRRRHPKIPCANDRPTPAEECAQTIAIGDAVEKVTGYKWPGTVVASFKTLGGKTRFVVECTAQEVEGALHIYAPEQIRKKEEFTR